MALGPDSSRTGPHLKTGNERGGIRSSVVYRQAAGAGSCGARIRHRVAVSGGGPAVAYGSAVNELAALNERGPFIALKKSTEIFRGFRARIASSMRL